MQTVRRSSVGVAFTDMANNRRFKDPFDNKKGAECLSDFSYPNHLSITATNFPLYQSSVPFRAYFCGYHIMLVYFLAS